MNIAETFALAWSHHQAGRFAEAERCYEQVVRADPAHADGWCFLGAACQAQGRLAEAETHLYRAVQLAPSHASAQNCLGVVQAQQGNYTQAVTTFQKALQHIPDSVEILNNLGLALSRQGENAQAIDCYRRVLSRGPNNPHGHYNLGLALKSAGDREEAAKHFREALRIQPDFVEAMNDLANTLVEQDRLVDAVALYQQALHVRPQYAEAHHNFGVVLTKLERFSEAIDHYREAVRFKPDFRDAHNNLGSLLARDGRWSEAAGHYYQVLRLQPNNTVAYTSVGRALAQQGKHAEALTFYQRALQLSPNEPLAHCDVGDALADMYELDQAVAAYKKALEIDPESADAHFKLSNVWLSKGRPTEAVASLRQALKFKPEMTQAQHNFLFSLNHDPDADLDEVFAEHRKWGKACCSEESLNVRSAECEVRSRKGGDHGFRNSDSELINRRLRIGYMSPDFRQHALNRYLQPVLTHHDREKFEVYCYSEVKKPDVVTAALQRLVHAWCSTRNVSDESVAAQIREDSIDILVDLAGHTAGNRLRVFALKPGPVQATWLGYLNTTGLATVDYRITDEVLDPPGQPTRDTEQLMRLPGGFCCFSPPTDAPDIGPLPALSRRYLTFGSLHSLFKLNARVLDLWCEVLRALPTSRLLIFRDTLAGTVVEHLRNEFTQRGIDPARLDLRTGSGAPGYLGIYSQIDVSLDVFPWTGGVTTCESLWMGVPMLSIAGPRPAQRNTAAILANVGLSQWAVTTPKEFVAKARSLPHELDQLSHLRGELRQRMTATICDAARFTRGLEDAYRTMWRTAISSP